ncbi:MAG: hypothetical protein JWN70_2267 [Planctomycetaceae bacterium]|nr:hypothetical protein [Planctomycetaceae bacterium]
MASRIAIDSDMYKGGLDAGQKWAKEFAEAAELKRLERLHVEAQHAWEAFFEHNENHSFTTHETLHASLKDFDRPCHKEASDFFEDNGATTEEMCDSGYLRGFADGALNVWNEVKDQL